jgi:hypothetical protein
LAPANTERERRVVVVIAKVGHHGTFWDIWGAPIGVVGGAHPTGGGIWLRKNTSLP